MMNDRLWAIVLAGGEGTRLAETTQRVYGSSLPKQFQSFGRARTFLQATVDRIAAVVPSNRTVVVVSSAHEAVAREQLGEFSGIDIVPQPRNQGTLAGVLLPLVHVLSRAPDADIALIPSDHDFTQPHVMLDALCRAQRAAHAREASMVLLGARAEHPASDLGWMVTMPGPNRDVAAIREFVEKPPQAVADRLFRAGALWNTMLSVTRGRVLWKLARLHAREQAVLFEEYASTLRQPRGRQRLRDIYERMSQADFSRDLVALSGGLQAIAMDGAGWSDCGTPERLEAALGPVSGFVATRAVSHAISA